MRITITWTDEPIETQVHITSHKAPDDKTKKLLDQLNQWNKEIIAFDGDIAHKLSADQILYIDAVDDKTYLYTNQKVYESRQKLYEWEQALESSSFIRISKAVVLNVDHVLSVKPLFAGKLEACLSSGEKQVVNRHYVPIFRRYFGL